MDFISGVTFVDAAQYSNGTCFVAVTTRDGVLHHATSVATPTAETAAVAVALATLGPTCHTIVCDSRSAIANFSKGRISPQALRIFRQAPHSKDSMITLTWIPAHAGPVHPHLPNLNEVTHSIARGLVNRAGAICFIEVTRLNAVDLLSMLMRSLPLSFHHALERELANRDDWSDILAMKGAREVLSGIRYPNDATRRSLYASWLKVFASNVWDKTFDHLMLECVAATPSPTAPWKPLFFSIYRVRDVMDLPLPDMPTPVLNVARIPKLFARKLDDFEPLPSSPGFVDYLADLIRKSSSSRAALTEAGLIIGFYSLALSVVVAKPVREVQDFFRTRMKRAMTTAVPTSFDGDAFCCSGRFLTELARKTFSDEGLVKPYLVLLVLAQYSYHVHANEAPPGADVNFLEEGFLTEAKFGQLKIIRLLYDVQEKTALSAKVLNRILGDCGSQEVATSSQRVLEFLQDADEPMQKTRPWCRAASVCFFVHLDVGDHLDYVMRLTAFLAPDPNDLLWQCPEFADVPVQRMRDARVWARNFKRALRKGKYGAAVRLDQL
ncbi:hypothetical protein HPB50_005807 [Hyalomma asiaticum]|uniref:Uncharacterized protein n=1 Tax=Hyalomma asiaticum TaxID=266040 RepID=A0ACB7RMM0_HYAAI|nr:hypothetical protein HPB50_005807 [Hyalomma asiaticum]